MRGKGAIRVMVTAACLLAGCEDAERPCASDSVGNLHLVSTLPACTADDWMCKVKCRLGHTGSCLAMAYVIEKESRQHQGEPARLYRRACVLGAASACTNHAAGIWVDYRTAEQLSCALRTFQKACAAKEPFACGMVGRVMLESTKPPQYAEGRRYLERACEKVGGFPCRVLAKHLESGKLGDYQPETVRTLLARACAGGDPDACGEPRTASETFR